MTPTTAWAVVALGMLVLITRRRSLCILLMSLQSALIGVAAVAAAPQRSEAFAVAAAVLILKAVVMTAFLSLAVRGTREHARVRADLDPLARLTATLAAVAGLDLLVPSLPFMDQSVQDASFALLGIGLAAVVTRRATILQLIGILMCENAVALAAVSTPGGMPLVIEMGAAFHLLLFLSVGLAFHRRIYEVLGSGDSALLRALRD